MHDSIPSGIAASPKNIELASRPTENSRAALYACALAQYRFGQFQQAKRVAQELMAQASRFLDGKNYYAAKRVLYLVKGAVPKNCHTIEESPKFTLDTEARLQFDLLCACEESGAGRWENARIILQSVCQVLDSSNIRNIYTASAPTSLAHAIRREWLTVRNRFETSRETRELANLWQAAIEQSSCNANQWEHERPAYHREKGWFELIHPACKDPFASVECFEEGARVAQSLGMIREEYGCLADWRQMIESRIVDASSMSSEWYSRWCCLARQFAEPNERWPSLDLQIEGVIGELEKLCSLSVQAQRGGARPACYPPSATKKFHFTK